MARYRLRATLAGPLVGLTALALGLAACGTDSNSGGGGGGSTISIWEGWTGAEAKTFAHLVTEYQNQNPGQKVSSLYVNNDNTLQKVLTAVRGGSPPDIAYLYGSWAPNVAQIPQVVNLTKVVQRPGVNWNDFWVGERDVATVKGKVIGVPALVNNLAVVYNKTLFAKAHLTPPGPGWTWSQFQADAKKLTDPAIKQFGTAYVTPGSEDTVWHWEALLWEADGQILTADNKKAAFDSPAGLKCADYPAENGRHRQVHVPGPDRLRVRQPVQLGQDRDAGHRALGPVRVPQRARRRPGHAGLPRRQPPVTRPFPGRTTGSCSTTGPPGSPRRRSSSSGSPRPPR